jgi:predicted transcriptional regulator
MDARQVRAARALLGISQATLAETSGVSLPTIKRIETMDGPLRIRLDTLRSIQSSLEAAGVVFIPGNGEGPGVRLRKNNG